ncbi:MAG: pentapeptide repeat-containing protein [Acidobacteriota bacterium]
MVEESSPLLPSAEESIEAETDTALEPDPKTDDEPSPEPASEPGFVCDCEEWMRSACTGLPFYKEHEDQRYCVLHYPGKEKSADFKAALDTKLIKKDFDFRGVWFPDEVDFKGFEFSAAADFRYATFSKPANFSSATFRGKADFSWAIFGAVAGFMSAVFSADTHFLAAAFSAMQTSALPSSARMLTSER